MGMFEWFVGRSGNFKRISSFGGILDWLPNSGRDDRLNRSYGFLFIPILLLSLSICSCNQQKAEVSSNEALDESLARKAKPINESAIQEVAPILEENTAEALWNSSCSFCHSQERLHGKTAANIRMALDAVRAMSHYKKILTDEDIEALGALLSGEPQVEEYRFITSKACETCHPNHMKQWRELLIL